MAPTPSGNFALYDRILDGQLADKLRGWRSRDPQVSYDDIVDLLAADSVFVSRETVGRWCRTLGLVDPDPTPEAA